MVSKFDEWLAGAASAMPQAWKDAAAFANDMIWTAQKIVEDRFGVERTRDPEVVLRVFEAMAQQIRDQRPE